jgi:hypothetical protein
MPRTPLLLLVMSLTVGCGVKRTLTVNSNPPGALVYLNGLEVGRTPMTRDFTWYGTYDVELRKEGYDTLKTRGEVIAPWWQWVPFDFFAEFLPFRPHDRRELSYVIKPTTQAAADPQTMIRRAGEMRGQLESSKRTRSAGQ